MEAFQRGGIRIFLTEKCRKKRIFQKTTSEHDRFYAGKSLKSLFLCGRRNNITIIAKRAGKHFFCSFVCTEVRRAAIALLLESWMDDQLCNRVFLIKGQKCFPFRLLFHADPGLDGNRQRTSAEDFVKKGIKLIRTGKEAGTPPLGNNGSGGAAEVQIDSVIAVRRKVLAQGKKVLCPVCQDLGNGTHPTVMLRQNIVLFSAAHMTVTEKGCEVFVNTAIVLMKGIAENVGGKSLHGSHVIVHKSVILK